MRQARGAAKAPRPSRKRRHRQNLPAGMADATKAAGELTANEAPSGTRIFAPPLVSSSGEKLD